MMVAVTVFSIVAVLIVAGIVALNAASSHCPPVAVVVTVAVDAKLVETLEIVSVAVFPIAPLTQHRRR